MEQFRSSVPGSSPSTQPSLGSDCSTLSPGSSCYSTPKPRSLTHTKPRSRSQKSKAGPKVRRHVPVLETQDPVLSPGAGFVTPKAKTLSSQPSIRSSTSESSPGTQAFGYSPGSETSVLSVTTPKTKTRPGSRISESSNESHHVLPRPSFKTPELSLRTPLSPSVLGSHTCTPRSGSQDVDERGCTPEPEPLRWVL